MSKQSPANLSIHQTLAGDWPGKKSIGAAAIAGSPCVDRTPGAQRIVEGTEGSESRRVTRLGNNLALDSEINRDFVADCARNIEGLRSDGELKEAWGLDEHGWSQLSENAPLLEAIKAERERRIRNGEAAREAAKLHYADTPSVLSEILHNVAISPRHRIEAAKELRQVACSAPEDSTSAGAKFVISINLGADHRLVKDFDLPARIPRDDGTEQ
jgi:hypothetical protein